MKLLRVARDALDARNDGTTVADVGSLLVDDVVRPFRGADYEVILTRVMLAIFDLLIEAKDAYSYALQIGEKQEEIFGKPLGSAFEEAPDPREQYQRVSIGAYMEGLIHESNFANSSAEKAYTRAREWADGGVPILDECITRVTEGDFAPQGSGVMHVFYLAGRGPRLVQSRSEVTDAALQIAKIIALVAGKGQVILGQAPVPVPGLMIDDGRVSPLYITLPDGSQATTQVLLDTNQVAKQQIDANMPWIIARAVARRAIKAVASKQVENVVGKSRGATTGLIVGLLTNLFLTAGERADTRQWVALPSQIQVARVTVPEGEHALDFGQGMVARLRVFAGRESYVVVVRPNLAIPGTVLVDEFSLPQEQPAEAVETAPQP